MYTQELGSVGAVCLTPLGAFIFQAERDCSCLKELTKEIDEPKAGLSPPAPSLVVLLLW